jgi:hypothetical protein
MWAQASHTRIRKRQREREKNEIKQGQFSIFKLFDKCNIEPWLLETNKQTNYDRTITTIITRSAKCFLPSTFICINLFNFTDRCKRKKTKWNETKSDERTYIHSSYILYWPFFGVSYVYLYSFCLSIKGEYILIFSFIFIYRYS